MSGYFVVHRGVFDHIVFDDEPFSQREAWLWLIREAAWESRRVMVKCGNAREFLNLERGQVTHSERFLAELWKWSRQKVRGFLSRLEAAEMLTLNRDHLQVVITICNYDKYQFGANEKKPALDQHKTNTEPKKKDLKEIDDHDDTPRDEADEIVSEIGRVCGFESHLDWPVGWYGAHMRVQGWLNAGWQRELIIVSCKAQMARKRDGPPGSIRYFEKGIADAHARQSEPIPKGKPSDARHEKTPVSTGEHGWRERRDRTEAARAKFSQAVRAIDGCDEGDGSVVFLVPDARDGRS